MMRRQSLRPRQIDNHSDIQIVKSIEDIRVDEDVGMQISSLDELASMSTTDHPPPKFKKTKDIPIPFIQLVKNYERDVPADYEAPISYVRFQAVLVDSEEARVEVDLEIEDMKWLREHPKYGEDGDPRYQLSLEVFEKMIDVLERASGLINPSLITFAEAEQLFEKKLNMVKTAHNKVTVDVYNYWVQKRQQMKKPIMRKFWPQTPLNDTDPHQVFRPREKERYRLRKHRRNDMEGFRKMKQLREDFERSRALLKLVRRRERMKRLQVAFLDEIRRQTIYELVDTTGVPRVPKVPTEDDVEMRRRKKKKKFKKARLESIDKTGGKSKPIGFSTTVPIKVPSFMEYDTGANFQNTFDPLPQFPYFKPERTLFAASLVWKPKYRCQGRVGRGGRMIIDRSLVPISQYHHMKEVYARPSLYDPITIYPHKNDEAAVQPVGKPMIDPKRLKEIYTMSDSEDEILEPINNSDVKGPTLEGTRKVKYSMHI